MLEETLPPRRKPGRTGRVNAGKLEVAAAWRDPAPTIPVVLTSKEKRPPALVHVALVLPADPLVLALILFLRPKPHPTQGHNCQETGSLVLWPVLLHSTLWLLPSQAPCPELAEPITGPQESFHARFSKAFRCLRMHRDA